MTDPFYHCGICRRVVPVDYYARGFPPDAAKRKLKRQCNAAGCDCDPKYMAGVG